MSPSTRESTHRPLAFSDCSRRGFLARGSALAATLTTSGALAAPADSDPIAFFVVSDTHYLADSAAPQQLQADSRRITSGLIDTLNRLPGSEIPAEAGGGIVASPRGVIHAGDVIDSGDKNGKQWSAMQATEWSAYREDFGLEGGDGRLKYPVFEVHGNHDGPQGQGTAIEGIMARNRRRSQVAAVSENGLHCSWDWGPVHLLNLGITVGEVPEVRAPRRYRPLGSLDFLIEDLRERVGTSGRPVIITHHIDLARHTIPCDASDPAFLTREWHPCDVQGFHRAIRGYNVVAILYGHTHVRNVGTWDGRSIQAETGVPIFNVDNSSHFRGGQQAFLYFEIHRDTLRVREVATQDGWQTQAWTPQVWERPVRSS